MGLVNGVATTHRTCTVSREWSRQRLVDSHMEQLPFVIWGGYD